MYVTPAVSYLLTGFAGCSVDAEISRGARKLTWIPLAMKNKKNNSQIFKFFYPARTLLSVFPLKASK